MIVAVAQNNAIGDSHTNQLLWHLPEDLSRFYRLTKGHVVIMGNKTYQSLPNGKLPHRINLVLTHSPPADSLHQPLLEPTNSPVYFVTLDQLSATLSHILEKKIFVIGGSSIYKLLFPFCSVIHYTLVDVEPVGDVLFPFSREELTHLSVTTIDSENETWQTSTREGIRYRHITYHLK